MKSRVVTRDISIVRYTIESTLYLTSCQFVKGNIRHFTQIIINDENTEHFLQKFPEILSSILKIVDFE